MGAGAAARLLLLRPTQVKSAILAGFGDYAIEETVMEFPKSWPVPDSVPRPITARVWLEEGAKILEKGEMVPGHLASANLIGARVTGTDPKVMAAVIRGALMNSFPAEALQRVDIPVLILNGKADAANQKISGLLKAIPSACAGECEGDHNSMPWQPTFQQAVVRFFEEQWRLRRAT
jgi:pimeloyl-ACP methyl ester carboxylesterase